MSISNNNNNNPQHIIEQVLPLLLNKGIKNLTMDSVAKHLGISKRTLYEIFDSKEALILSVLKYMHKRNQLHVLRETAKVTNAMEAMAIALLCHIKFISNIDISFLRDMDEYMPQMRCRFEEGMKKTDEMLLKAFETGVVQGVFRNDVDYRVTLRLFLIQMESLKRMEEYFPPDVTLHQAISSISIGLLRGIATPQGMDILDNKCADILKVCSIKNVNSEQKDSLLNNL